MLRKIYVLFIARSLEFLKDSASLGWNLVLPVMLIAGFSIMFAGGEKPFFKVAVMADNNTQNNQNNHPFLSYPQIEFYKITDKKKSMDNVRLHKSDMLLDLTDNKHSYWINSLSQKGEILEKLLLSSSSSDIKMQKQIIEGKKVSYVDWVVPGIMGMNIMFSCLFGVGFVIVRYRKSGYLKRLNATPVTATEFILSQIASRMILIVIISIVLFGISYWILDLNFAGSYFDLIVILILGCLSIISLSLVVISRSQSEELASGMLNMLSWPMMFLSGVWFSLDGASSWVQKLADFFPLTHFLSASRAIIIDGESLIAQKNQIIVLISITIVCFIIGTLSFKWDKD
ncbi:MAG: ABC transporter permease [Gammaproteobacteria bacterium]|nr:MAG: ABC transporter permease [Gammaproteobacteria bacterium]